jgi:hypothetical protein
MLQLFSPNRNVKGDIPGLFTLPEDNFKLLEVNSISLEMKFFVS